jgi:aquaporin Z
MQIPLWIRQALAEFYGTFILVFIGTGSIAFGAGDSLLSVAFAFGLGAMIAIYTIGHISGAHLNPVVSLAMVLDRRMGWKTFAIYLIAQTAGALFASLTLLIGSGANAFVGLGVSSFTEPTTAMVVIIFEMFLTFILVYLVLAVSQRKSLQPFIGIIVAFTLVGLILIGGPISSASLNPIRSLAPALLTGGEALLQLWVFILGPTLGAILAVLFYRFLKLTDSDTLKS